LATELIVQPIIVLPQLQVRRLSGAVEVCWPASATDFQLEAAAGLASPLNWLPVEEEAIEQEDN
jgi:hypothetical protein